MSFQVLVKTTAAMQGSYPYDLGTREAAAKFVKRTDIWWYFFPLDEDSMDGGSWRRGGAWDAAFSAPGEHQEPDRGQGYGSHENLSDRALPRGPQPQQVIYDEAAKFAEDDGDDDRW
jgi:hypothetical protein